MMFTVQNILSVLYFTAFLIYTFLAYYLLVRDSKYRANTIFALNLATAAILALTYSYAVNADTFEEAFLMRRIAGAAWSFLFTLFLHTTIILTRGKKDKLKPWSFLLLYSYAILSLYFFCINDTYSHALYNLIHTPNGWQNLKQPPLFRIIISVHLLSSMVTSVILLVLWRRKTKARREKIQTTIIISSVLFTIVIGYTSDVIAKVIFKSMIPELTILVALVPLTLTWYSITKYKIVAISPNKIANEIVSNMNEGLIILNEEYLIFNINQYALRILGFEEKEILGNSLESLFDKETSKDLFFPDKQEGHLIGTEIVFSQHTEKVLHGKTTTIPVQLSIAPLYDKWGDFIGACLLFTNITEIKNAQQELKKAHDLLEAKIQKRTADLYNSTVQLTAEITRREYKNRWEQLLTKISNSFVTVNASNIEQRIHQMLDYTGSFFKVERSSIFLIDEKCEMIHCAHRWANTKENAVEHNTNKFSTSLFKWKFEKLSKGILIINDVEKLPPEAANEAQVLRNQHVLTTLLIPLRSGTRLIGYCRFDTVAVKRVWTEEDSQMFLPLTNILADGLAKIENEKNILQLAYFDSLTSLPNRFKIIDIINEKIRFSPKESSFAILSLDLDSFKNINDSLGHDAGDILIQTLSESLVNLTHNIDYVCRFGGDEFIIVSNEITEEKTLSYYINGVLALFKRSYTIKNQDFYITASLGVAIYPHDGTNAAELIQSADLAMYKAKELGKNRCIICSEKLREEIYQKSKLTHDLNKAIEHNELFLLYQPQVELKTGTIIGVEALLRWQHPVLGIISPSVFIPLAEQTGLIIPMGDWVLKTAITQAKQWQNLGLPPVSVAVNLSLSQFISDKFVKNIHTMLTTQGLDPKYLDLEITESIAMDRNSNILDTLTEFKKLGINISMDDFGTQYSSLSRIKQMPIDSLKIAMEFVQNLEEDPKNREITSIIISIAQIMNFKLIAEGAETEYQIEYLRQKQVDVVQGYYFYKPQSPDKIEELLKKQSV